MDASLTFPAPRVPDPPPPLESVLISLVENSDTSTIHIANPLTLDNFGTTDARRAIVYNLARLRDTLASPFNTPDRTLDRAEWLQAAFEIIASVHEGLRNAQLASPDFVLADTFASLDNQEAPIVHAMHKALDGLLDFFSDPDEDAVDLKTHCFRCIKSAQLPPLPQTLRSIQLTSVLDKERVLETLRNEAIREAHKEVDAWRSSQRDLLIARIVGLITDNEESDPERLANAAFDLSPDLKVWVEAQRSSVRSYARRSIIEGVDDGVISPWAKEALAVTIARAKASIEAEATAAFN
jgi:hypothetical protein